MSIKLGQANELDRYEFRITQPASHFSSQPRGPYSDLVYLARRLAALLHDIGKATLAFQGKMSGLYHYEYYRHDLVGFLMLRSRFASDNKPQDSQFVSELASGKAIWPDGQVLFDMPQKNANLDENNLKDWLADAPVFTMVS